MTERGSTLLSVIRDAYGRALYTHKAHEKEADMLVKQANFLRIGRVLLLGITTGGAVSVIFGENHTASLITGILATTTLCVELITFSFRPEEQVIEHRKKAKRLWSILEKYQNLISDLTDGRVSSSDAQSIRDSLSAEVASVYSSGPNTTPAGYKEAQAALKNHEERTFSEDEIDDLLPPALRNKGT